MQELMIAARAFECLLGLSLLLQTLEYLRMSAATADKGVWSWPVQRQDVAHAPARLQSLFDGLYAERVHRLHLVLRGAAACSLFWGSSMACAALLFISTLLLLIRWRGAFNGGSDFMSLIALTALLAAELGTPVVGAALAWRAALWYVAIQAITSYFISGAIKLRSAEWRNGRALPFFLDGGLYGPLAPHSLWRQPWLAMLCSWAFILWECAAPLALLNPPIAVAYCATASVFHCLVFRFFGLNRFFWAWLVNFPALIYCSAQW